MNTTKALSIIVSIILTLFIILLSYKIALMITPLSSSQANVLHFLGDHELLYQNFTPNEISHLQDVKAVMQKTNYVFDLLFIVALFFFLHFYREKELLHKTLLYTGIMTLSIITILTLGILLSFNTTFTLFHHLFFPQGNWIFGADSVLIQIFPLEFFVRISITIVTVSLILGAMSLLAAKKLSYNHTKIFK